MSRLAYLGPAGTFSHEALLAATPARAREELLGLATIHDVIMAVHDGDADLGLVPMENSLEGAVNATLDALAFATDDVSIVGEVVHPVRHCLIAAAPVELSEIATVVSHPHANAQCARFLRAELPDAAVLPASSTADAVRQVAEDRRPDAAALGTRVSSELYGCVVLRAGVEDAGGAETRFVWLARDASPPEAPGRWKTSLVFGGPGAEAPGWLVRCLAEFASREVNLVRIESRPRRRGLGRYIFFIDLEGGADDPAVAEAVDALRGHVSELKVLGSYPTA